MTPDQLLAHFDRVSDLPDSIDRLRWFVRILAVRGKLLPQVTSDEPATKLVCRTKRPERPARYASRSIRRIDGDCGLAVGEPETSPPPGWIWVPLIDIAKLESGHTPSRSRSDWWDGNIAWVGVVDARIHHGATIYETRQHTNEYGIANSAARILPKGTVCISRTASVGYVIILGKPMATSQDFVNWVPTDAVSSEWLQLVFMAETEALGRFGKGAVHQTIYFPEWISMHIALPPLAEQRRIVAKVDELMALCDQLEAAQVEREQRRDRLTAASLARLNQPADAGRGEEFRNHVRFHLDHLPRLTTRPEQIPAIRQAILSLAVRGLLVSQEAKDESAPKFGNGPPNTTKNRITFTIPQSWSWARVTDVADSRLGKMLDKAKNSGKSYPYLRNTNVHWFDIRVDELKTMRIEDAEVDNFLLRSGDVLICEGGHGIGRTAIWHECETPTVFQKALHRVRPGPFLDSSFFAKCMFVYFHAGILESYYTGVGIPHFTGVALSKLVFPLPPIAEQRRIVARADELLAICDELESQLTTAQAQRRRLLETLLHNALTTTLTTQNDLERFQAMV